MGKCLTYDTLLTVRNKKTGEIYEISVGELHGIAMKSLV